MSRTKARENAFKLLYSYEVNRVCEKDELYRLFLANDPVSEEELSFFNALIQGVREHREKLDRLISPRLRGWTLERVPKIDLTIMRLALFERFYSKEVPGDVAISEAIRLARDYSGDRAGQYINAVLGAVDRAYKELLSEDPELQADQAITKILEGDQDAS